MTKEQAHKIRLNVFEPWFNQQFSTDDTLLEVTEDGYKDEAVNFLWVGFVAGYYIQKENLEEFTNNEVPKDTQD